MATKLEQFLIEDQLFHDDAKEKVEHVNEAGDGICGPNSNNTNINESRDFLNFEQERVQSDDTNNSSNMDKNRFVDERPAILNIYESNENANQTMSTAEMLIETHSSQQMAMPHATETFKLHCQPKSTKCHTIHNRIYGVCGKSSPTKCNLVVHDEHDALLNEVERGTTCVSLHSYKRDCIDGADIGNARKKYRMNLDAAENFGSEFDESTVDEPSSSHFSYKSHALLYVPKRNAQNIFHEHNRDRFVNIHGPMIPYSQQERPLYVPHSRNHHSSRYANQRHIYGFNSN